MSDTLQSSYDDLPYSGNFFGMTHPDRIATMAILHGLTPTPPDRCRVLEIGCSDGGNLFPMARSLPDSHFVGIDLSPRQVGDGQKNQARLGLKNVELKAMSLMDVDEHFGTFDYIVCHGVYSWVPAEARSKILSICARNLSPDGLAYVSYNCYPGWHLRGMIREILLYHTRDFPEPRAKIGQARGFLDFLVSAVPKPEGLYAHVLKHEAELLGEARDTYLFHEHLEADNHPLYFHEFVAHAEAAGLQYAAPARFSSLEANLEPRVRGVLDQLGTDRVRWEQYLDFVQNRTFRHSLLCHAGRAVFEKPSAEAVRGLRVVSQAKPTSDAPDVHSATAEEFVSPFGDRLSTNRPMVKTALYHLFKIWPRSRTFHELWAEVDTQLGGTDGDPPTLAEALLRLHMSNLVELHLHEPRFALVPGERPLACPVARLQAENDTRIVNLRNRTVQFTEFDALVLRLLDGTRDREALVAALADWVADGTFSIHQGERPVDDPEEIRAVLTEGIEPALRRLASEALLVGDGSSETAAAQRIAPSTPRTSDRIVPTGPGGG